MRWSGRWTPLLLLLPSVACFGHDPWWSSWIHTSSLPSLADNCSAVNIDGLFYVLAGDAGDEEPSGAFFSLDPSSMSWSILEDVPSNVSGTSVSVAWNRTVYLFYDANVHPPDDDSPRVASFSPATGEWNILDANQQKRTSAAVAIAPSGVAYIMGGYIDGNRTAEVETFDLKTLTWRSFTPLPEVTADATAITAGHDILIIGGTIRDEDESPVWSNLVFNLNLSSPFPTWSFDYSVTPLIQSHGMPFPTSILVGSYLWVIGNGYPIYPYESMTVFVYDLYATSWNTVQVPGPQKPRFQGCVAAATGSGRGNLFLFGGTTLSLPPGLTDSSDEVAASRYPATALSRPDGADGEYWVGGNVTVTISQINNENPYLFRLSSSVACEDDTAGTTALLWDGGSQSDVVFKLAEPAATAYLCFSVGHCPATHVHLERCFSSDGTDQLTFSACAELGCCFYRVPDIDYGVCFKRVSNTSDPTAFSWMTPLLWGAPIAVAAPPPTTPAPTHVTPAPPTPVPTTAGPAEPEKHDDLKGLEIALLVAAACSLLCLVYAGYRCVGGGRGRAGYRGLDEKRGGANPFFFLMRTFGRRSDAARLAPTADSTPAGRYEALSKLGSGGYGHVFLVKEKRGGRRLLALKYIQVENDEERRDALSEFETMKALQGHPNMINLVDMFMSWTETADDGSDEADADTANRALSRGNAIDPAVLLQEAASKRYVCLVMEYYAAGDLKAFILRQKKHLNEITVWFLVNQVCQALTYMHSRQSPVMHRDLKPENLLMTDVDKYTDDGVNLPTTVVTDLGLAKGLAEQTYCQTQAGSLPYVAPECWQRRYSVKVDTWALGCIVYAICTRRVENINTRVMFSDVNSPTFKSDIKKDLTSIGYSKAVVTFVLLLLTVDPHARPTAEFCEEFASQQLALSGLEISRAKVGDTGTAASRVRVRDPHRTLSLSVNREDE